MRSNEVYRVRSALFRAYVRNGGSGPRWQLDLLTCSFVEVGTRYPRYPNRLSIS